MVICATANLTLAFFWFKILHQEHLLSYPNKCFKQVFKKEKKRLTIIGSLFIRRFFFELVFLELKTHGI